MPRVTITVPEKTPQPYRFQLDRNSVTIGRGSENDIAIDSGSISVKHAEMRRVPGGYELRDLGSTNGIKIYGSRHHVVQLRNGIPVKLGDVSFDFLLSEDELTELASEKTPTKAAETPAPVVASEPKLTPSTDSTEDVKSVEANDEAVKDEAKSVGSEDSESESEESPSESNGGSGCAMIVLFLILASVAFAVGMEIRSRKDTGESLINTIKAKIEALTAPAKEKPAPTSDETQAAPKQPE